MKVTQDPMVGFRAPPQLRASIDGLVYRRSARRLLKGPEKFREVRHDQLKG
jgi:hypothetical protein